MVRKNARDSVTGYHAYFLDSDAQLLAAHRLACDCDESACELAGLMAEGDKIEIWFGDRLVTRMNAGEAPGGVRHAEPQARSWQLPTSSVR